jgi:hypothetical protein
MTNYNYTITIKSEHYENQNKIIKEVSEQLQYLPYGDSMQSLMRNLTDKLINSGNIKT